MIAPIGESEVGDLQALLEACTAYAEQVTGYPTGPSDALSTLLHRPDGVHEDAKTVLGHRAGGRLLGCVDLVIGRPDLDTATIGLLLVRPDARRRGVGRLLHGAAATVARAAGAHRLRVGVVDTAADSVPFWRALGHEPEGDATPYRYDHLRSTVRHWTMPLP